MNNAVFVTSTGALCEFNSWIPYVHNDICLTLVLYGPGSRTSPEFQKLLGIAMEMFLLCSDDSESDVRMVADECLNKIIKVSRALFPCFSVIKQQVDHFIFKLQPQRKQYHLSQMSPNMHKIKISVI